MVIIRKEEDATMKKKLLSIFLTVSIISSGIPVFAVDDAVRTESNNIENIQATEIPVASPLVLDNNLEDKEYNVTNTLPAPSVEPKVVLYADAVDKSEDFSKGNITLSEPGQYIIQNVSTMENTITVTTTGIELIVYNVTADLSGKTTTTEIAPIKILSGASLALHLQDGGTNTFKGASNGAGIAVYATDTVSAYGTLTIDGKGTLIAQGGAKAPGIGTNLKNKDGSTGINGKIIITDGNITATGGSGAAGIGSPQNGRTTIICSAEIAISGGSVTATGGSGSAGIGGGTAQKHGKITISGGYVKALGGQMSTYNPKPSAAIGSGNNTSGGASTEPIIVTGGSIPPLNTEKDATSVNFGKTPQNESGDAVSMFTMTMPISANINDEKEVTINGLVTKTDENGKLYIYLPSNTRDTSFALSYNGKIYYTIIPANSDERTFDLIEYDGAPCKCTADNASVVIDVSDQIIVNKRVGQQTSRIATNFIKAIDCKYPIHGLSVSYELTMDNEEDISKYVKEENGFITVYYAAAGKTIHIKSTVENNGISYETSKDINIIGDSSWTFDLSTSSIEIERHATNENLITVLYDSTTYEIEKTEKIYIKQDKDTTSNTIKVGMTRGATASSSLNPTIVLQGINVQTQGKSIFYLNEHCSATLELEGDNVMYSPLFGGVAESTVRAMPTCTLTIQGDGTLTATSDGNAGIGNVGHLVINNGTIIANGGSGGAGIGGADNVSGIDVTINGGKVIATGDGNAAGIGGGAGNNGTAGTFTMNGGTVIAKSKNNGKGIGGGGKSTSDDMNKITINGGSVCATMYSRPKLSDNTQYLVTLDIEGITEETEFTYTVGDSDVDKIPVTAIVNDEGKAVLYLYLTAGRQWIRVYRDDKVYYKYINVKSSEENIGTCVLNPDAGLNNVVIPGQIGEMQKDPQNNIIGITVPYNIKLDSITPVLDYNGCECSPAEGEVLDFSGDGHTVEFTILGDDKSEHKYSVTLTLAEAPNPPVPDEYDISQGDVIILDDSVEYGGTIYESNPLGYVITGSSDEHIISIDAGQELPPITFKDVNVSSVSSVSPLRITSAVDVNISVEGKNRLTSLNTAVIDTHAYGKFKINITGLSDSSLSIIGTGNSSPTINLPTSDTSLQIIGPTTKILGGFGQNAIGGGGEFITDSITNIQIKDNGTTEIIPKDKDGNTLHQLIAELKTSDTSHNSCNYNETIYYLDDDMSFYLMLPDDNYDMSVIYNNNTYIGEAVIDGADEVVELYTVTVTDIKMNKSQLTYEGGDVEFEVEGKLIADNVTIRLQPNIESVSSIDGLVTQNGDKTTVTISIPQNDSYQNNIIYTVYYVIKDISTEWTPKKTIIVSKDTTVSVINKFELEGQNSSSIDQDMNIISVYMPYDHTFKEYYATSELEFVGSRITGEEGVITKGVRTQYNLINNRYMRDIYTVHSSDNTSRQYRIQIYKDPVPNITSIRVNNRTLANAGGKVTATMLGKAFSSIFKAENAANKKVYIYSDGIEPVEAKYNGEEDEFTAEISLPANNSSEEDKEYILKAKIGDTEQTAETSVKVLRQQRDIALITSFEIENQIDAKIGDDTIEVTVPYDMDITSVTPSVTLGDVKSQYTPRSSINFTSPIQFTVTAENGIITKNYIVTVHKQAEPIVSTIDFENPKYSSAGNVTIKVNGQNIENSQNAVTANGGIVVKCESLDGYKVSSIVEKDKNNEFTAILDIPSNTSSSEKIYTISVEVNGKEQTILGNTTLIVPAREPDTCEMTDIFLVEGQGEPVFQNDGLVELFVPYNTDLSNIIPKINHTGASYLPEGQVDFNSDVQYMIIAANGNKKNYTVRAIRSGSPYIYDVLIDNPTSHKPKDVTVTVKGEFIPYLTEADKRNGKIKDAVIITATPVNGGTPISAAMEYNKYSGEAVGHFTNLPNNNTSEVMDYIISITLNGVNQNIGSVILSVPIIKDCIIKSFVACEKQIGTAVIKDLETNKSTITFDIPYDTDIRALIPEIEIDADAITPSIGTAQNFEQPVVYVVSAEDKINHEYTVTANRVGAPSINAVTMSDAPTTFKGGKININFSGVFHHEAKLEAVPNDGSETIKGAVTMNERHSAEAVINLPVNNSYSDREYTLVFYLDGFEEGIYSDYTVTVPRRTPRTITKFEITGIQDGETRIEGTNIYVDIPYYRFAEIESVVPTIEYDADAISPNKDAVQNFRDTANPVKYTLTSEDDEAVTYTVHINYVGDKPQIKSFTVDKQKKETVYENDTISIVLPSSAKLKEIEPIIDFVGTDYSPKGPQDFTNSKKEPVVYTVVDKYGIEQKYNVTITKQKSGSNNSVTTPTPTVIPTKEPDATPAPTETVKPTNKPYMSGYEDGTYRPDNTITRAEVATILSMLDDSYDENERYESASADVNPDAWYANYVNFASSRGYMSGYEDGTYRPDNTITRAEFASMVSRYIGIDPIDGENRFADIDSVPWCSQQINALSEAGIVSGYEDGLFKPSNYVTRAESASIINRALGKEIPENVLDRIMCPYQDITASHWAYIDTIIASCEF